MQQAIMFSTDSSRYFAEILAQRTGITLGEIETNRFGDKTTGELYLRFKVDDYMAFANRDVILVGSTCTDHDIDALYRLGCTASEMGARRLLFVVPFFGYSTMERAVKPGEVVTAKVIARQFSSIPQASEGNFFLFLDLHVSGLLHYFEGACKRFELYAESVLEKAIQSMWTNDMVFGSADLGRPKWVDTYARRFNTDLVLVRKIRDGKDSHITHVIGDVKDRVVCIYDDMTRSSKTLVQAMAAYLKYDAAGGFAVLSHGAFNDDAAIYVIGQSFLKKVIITNSHPMSNNPLIVNSEKFIVVDVTPIFAEAIQRILGIIIEEGI